MSLLTIVGPVAFAADITRGATGDSVRYIQELLINQGYLLDRADGIFGNNTEYAIRVFQGDMKLSPTGVIDSKTLAAIKQNNERFKDKAATTQQPPTQQPLAKWEGNVYARFGDRNDNVRLMQDKLSINGYLTGGVDGIFGNATVNAVRKFQQDNRLNSTGIIDESTRQALDKAPGRPTSSKKRLVMEASAYSSQDPGNGLYTASGNRLRSGLIAVDPAIIPLGTRVYIEGYGYVVADDIGGNIIGNRIDVAVDTYAEAMQFGRRSVVVYIL